ncbi:unnamed protein product [Orchesella dallaii]|uniref:Uncharacterized protein n=1 Tax=Orchesella dallaii TaxID=48710 RepID=A0ABP1Q8C9_9HEXA
MKHGILIRFVVLCTLNIAIRSETTLEDSGEDEISEIEALLDYELGLIYYKDINLNLCFVENAPNVQLESIENVDLPILKIPIEPDNLNYTDSANLPSSSDLGIAFCEGLTIVLPNGLKLFDQKVKNQTPVAPIRRKRQTYGNHGNYYGGGGGGGSGSYQPMGAAGAQSNFNPGQASQAQVQGQVFGRGIFSGQAQSQNGGLSQSQVQLAGIGVSGQISSSSGNAQAQLALGTGAGSGQASGLGQGPSNSQVQVTLGQQGEESMASASATSGGATAGASSLPGNGYVTSSGVGGRGGHYGQPGGTGGPGWIPGAGYGGVGGGSTSPLQPVSPGISRDPYGRGGDIHGRNGGSQIPQHHLGSIPSGTSQGVINGGGIGSHYGQQGGNGVGSFPSRTQPTSNGVSGIGTHPSYGYGGAANGYGTDSSRLGTGLPTNGGGSGLQTTGLGSGLPTTGQGSGFPTVGLGHGTNGLGGIGSGLNGARGGGGTGVVGQGSDLGTTGTGLPQGTIQSGIGGSGTLPTSVGTNGQYGTPGTYARPGANGYDTRSQGVGYPGGTSGTGITSPGGTGGINGLGGHTTPTNGAGVRTNGAGTHGGYGIQGPSSGTTYTNGHGQGRPYAQSNTPGAYAATYGGMGQAQAQTVYFGSVGNGQYAPVRYAQSSQPGNGQGTSRYQDQQVGYGTAGQRQQSPGTTPSQNGGGIDTGARTTYTLPSGQSGTNGHQPVYTNGAGTSVPGTNGHRTTYTNGAGTSVPGTNGYRTTYTNGGGGSLPGTNGHRTIYANGGVGSFDSNGHRTFYTNGIVLPPVSGQLPIYTNGGGSGTGNGHQPAYTNGGGGSPSVQIPTTNVLQPTSGDLGTSHGQQQQPSTVGSGGSSQTIPGFTGLDTTQLGYDGTSTGGTGLQGPLGPDVTQPQTSGTRPHLLEGQPQTTGYTNGRGVQNGYRQPTVSNGRNGHSYGQQQPAYQYPGSGISTPTINGNGQAYRINEYGQVVPSTQVRPPTSVSGQPETSQRTDQSGFSPSYGVSQPSQEGPDSKKCTIITFSCTIVIESNGRAKICKPNAVKMNGNGNGNNGSGYQGGNGRNGGPGSKVCCC